MRIIVLSKTHSLLSRSFCFSLSQSYDISSWLQFANSCIWMLQADTYVRPRTGQRSLLFSIWGPFGLKNAKAGKWGTCAIEVQGFSNQIKYYCSVICHLSWYYFPSSSFLGVSEFSWSGEAPPGGFGAPGHAGCAPNASLTVHCLQNMCSTVM